MKQQVFIKIIYNCEDKDIMFDSQQRLKNLNR